MLKVDIISFAYSKPIILTDLDFELKIGNHLAVLGESGCGKSTLLHIIYGLLHLENGSIYWKDKRLMGPKHNLVPGEDFIKLVAQEYNVMPFTTVAENVAEHLSRQNPIEDEKRVMQLLSVVELTEFSNVMVKNLSGGQKQRVALAKALANEPELLLLDEPFSHIDTFRKNKLRRKVYRYLKASNIACITATHDASEALAFSDQILLLKNGRAELFGPPVDVYNNVATSYQAGFFDEVNELPAALFKDRPKAEKIILFPHQLAVSEVKTPLRVEVQQSFFKGSRYLIMGLWNNTEVFFEAYVSIPELSIVYLAKKR